jgi:hypothetical protein
MQNCKPAILLPIGRSPCTVPRQRLSASEPVHHGADRGELHARLGLEVRACIAPPIPASLGIGGRGSRVDLWVKYDDVVGVGPFIVAELGIDVIADIACPLLAAVKDDMNGAALAGGALAGSRNIDIAGMSHAS